MVQRIGVSLVLLMVGCGGRVEPGGPGSANLNGNNPGDTVGQPVPTDPGTTSGGTTSGGTTPGGTTTVTTVPPNNTTGTAQPGPPPAEAACWYSQLPAEVLPILPKVPVAQACKGAMAGRWDHPDGGSGAVGYDGDARSDIVGRWVPCGAATFSSVPHAGVEFGANGRWRLLIADANGALVSSSSNLATGRYYALGNGQLEIHDEGFVSGNTFLLSFSTGLDAILFNGSGSSPGSSTYARTDPSPLNGRDNLPSVTDGKCSMVGSWDVPANPSPPGAPAATFSFDAIGNFVGGPRGSDLCSAHTMYGTYRLSPELFQLTTNVGMGFCSWWFDAGYPATFDATCTKMTIKTNFDNCTGGRGYFNGETTLTRRQ